jgi:hypothetical protein
MEDRKQDHQGAVFTALVRARSRPLSDPIECPDPERSAVHFWGDMVRDVGVSRLEPYLRAVQ